MNKKQMLLIGAIALAGFSAGRFSGPKETEIKEVERVVYRDRVVKDEDKKARTAKKETVLPDGTRITETVRESERETHSETRRDAVKEKELVSSSKNLPDWSIGVYKSKDAYLGTVDRRILGGFSIGIYGRTDLIQNSEFGLGLRLEF